MKQVFKIFALAAVMFFIMPETGSAQSSSHRGYLGIYSQSVTRSMMKKYNLPDERGAYVTSVVDGSAADEAGIRRRDVITKVGDETIYDEGDLTDAIRHCTPGTDIKIDLYRDGEKKTITAKVDKLRSSNRSYSYNFDPGPHSWHWLSNLFHGGDRFPASQTGVEAQDLTRQLAEYFGIPDGNGVLLSEIRKGGVVDKAGFKAGDVVTKIEGHTTDDLDDLLDQLDRYEGKSVSVEIARNGKTMTLPIKIPDEDEDWY